MLSLGLSDMNASLNYTGINRHEGEAVGGFDTVLARDEFDRCYRSQQDSLKVINRSCP